MTTSTAAEAERKEERYSSPLVEDQMIVDMLYGAEAMSPGLIEAYCTFTRDNLRDGDRLAVE
jgi:hypothetical protein